ncbi:hypothetical protein ABFT23_18410 [Nocardioides sp. C4-1]|uniref:hypothetical protein n=1 Tax=Nocardioides sp. C4-1 TaxID=3151851 RepID=UPI00326710C0
MRRAVVALPVLLLALAGCGDGGSPDDADDPSPSRTTAEAISACGDLTDADVARLTGQGDVTHVEKQQPFGSVCTFTADGSPSVMILAGGGATTAADIVELSTPTSDEGEVSTEDVEVPGTDEALLVTDTSYDLTTTSLVAVVGDVGYTVYGTGPTADDEGRVAIAVLTILLGGTSDVPDAEPQAHPCDALTGEEVGTVLDTRVTAQRGELGDGLRCTYGGPDGVGVLVYTLDRTAPVESLADSAERQGAAIEEVPVGDGGVARLVQRDSLDVATVYVATTRGVFVLDVDATDDPARSVAVARELAPLLAG